jgi:hypothetical protein
MFWAGCSHGAVSGGAVMNLTESESEAETAPVSPPQPGRGGRGVPWLILSGYLLGAVAVTGRLWVNPAGRVPAAAGAHDSDAFAWYVRYAATAVEHGRLPALVTTALNAPHGVNLMWNTSFLLPGVLLTPVTLLAGPQVSLTVALTVGFAGSAAALFWLLRRWGASTSAAVLGGAVYGFSPALLDSALGHYNLQFAVLPPLMIDALLRIVTGRGRAGPAGAWLGLLAAAQFFIGSELLSDTVLAGLVLVVVLAAVHPRTVPARVRGAVLGLGAAAVVALVLCSRALWVQFFGPFTEHNVLPYPWSGNLGFFVDPPSTLLLHTSASAAVAGHFSSGLAEYLPYLGWPLLVVLIAGSVWFWREPRIRAAAVTWALLELIALGGGTLPVAGLRVPALLLPFHWLQSMPVFSEVLPDRFAILADGAAGATLALCLDRARSSARAPGWAPRGIPVAVAVLAVLPLIPAPLAAAPAPPLPAGWQAAFARLHLAPDARVLVVPIPNIAHTQPMRWQADTGEPGSMIGGYYRGPGPGGQPSFDPGPGKYARAYIDGLWGGRGRVSASSVARIRPSLAYWRPAAVVAVTNSRSALADVLIRLFGRPTFRVGQVLAWRLKPPG